ncbi:MAG: NUDIX hydrolase [Pseudonocardiaceae bacterium]
MHYTSFVDVLLLLVRQDHVLLAERCNTGYADGQWNLPSGKLDRGEDLQAAVIRETREEIGLRLHRDAVRMVTTVHYLNPEGHARVGFFFHPLRWDGEPRNTEPHKCARIGWFPLGQLPHNTVPYSRAGIELYRRREPFGLQGWPNPAEAVSVYRG